MSYQNVIAAISESLADQHFSEVPAPDGFDCADVARQIADRQESMPEHLRLPIRVLTWVFDLSAFFRHASRFQSLSAADRDAHLQSWRSSSVGVLGNTVRFYESLFLLIALDEAGA